MHSTTITHSRKVYLIFRLQETKSCNKTLSFNLNRSITKRHSIKSYNKVMCQRKNNPAMSICWQNSPPSPPKKIPTIIIQQWPGLNFSEAATFSTHFILLCLYLLHNSLKTNKNNAISIYNDSWIGKQALTKQKYASYAHENWKYKCSMCIWYKS